MRKERKHYTAEEKGAILRRHLLDKVPVSDLCEELGLQPTELVARFPDGALHRQLVTSSRNDVGRIVDSQVSKSTVYRRCRPSALLCWRFTPDTFIR